MTVSWAKTSRAASCCDGLTCGGGQNHVGLELDYLLRKRWQSLRITIGVAIGHIEITALGVTEFSHSLQKGIYNAQRGGARAAT